MIMRKQALDFVQLTYNVLDREVEDRLLPLAQEKGIAVIANRPFRQKALIRRFEARSSPYGRMKSRPRTGRSSC
jgi:aryl-alcohol dehydrogenase-like predicted oxidoreductase